MRITAVAAILTLCVAGGISAGAMLLREAAHPLATRDSWLLWLIYDLPYFLMVAAGLLSFSRRWWLAVVAMITVLVTVTITATCLVDTEMSLQLMTDQVNGRFSMNCGPPLFYVVMPVVYLISAITVGVSLMLLPLQRERFSVGQIHRSS